MPLPVITSPQRNRQIGLACFNSTLCTPPNFSPFSIERAIVPPQSRLRFLVPTHLLPEPGGVLQRPPLVSGPIVVLKSADESLFGCDPGHFGYLASFKIPGRSVNVQAGERDKGQGQLLEERRMTVVSKHAEVQFGFVHWSQLPP